jgi:acyl transferase domain-containing protein/NAD(P)-dependent dehydrogenase (short-subunit alcohol dehydrogenase family)
MKTNKQTLEQPVAIIGMGGMFARSNNLKAYWRALLNGIDCITEPPATHCRLNDYFDNDPKRPDHIYCNRGGFLPTMPFDPTEFGIPPAALEATDTSQLLGLVGAKMALADAGYGEGREFDRENTSVILGVTGTQELVISLGSRLGHPLWRRALENKGLSDDQKEAIVEDIANGYVPWQESSFPGLLGNVVAGRICNRLNLGGTNCVVDAACASSLSAVHLALLELSGGRSNLVVTGGVDTINDIFMHMCFSKTGVLSHSGDARPFSADADGTVLGEGIGIIVLKRLTDAERDGDRIYAVIRGIGSSSDGKSQSIYAPRAEGQARALSEAYRHAGIPPETVGLVEAHGTGTRVGDEVEFTALRRVFAAHSPNGNHCALGSVKSMIGHTKAAAGAAGLIKSALALHHKVLPPTIKADRPDPKLKIESSPFYLNTAARPWFSQNGNPRRCGVSSFGFGGSNFHVVLEEYQPSKTEVAWDGSVEILAFSGTTAESVSDAIRQLVASQDQATDPSFLSRTARTLRDAFSADHPFRMTIVLDTSLAINELKDRLQAAVKVADAGKSATLSAKGIYYLTTVRSDDKIAFMFPGQGSQYTHMGRDLVCMFPQAMAAVESADHHADQGNPLVERIFPRPAISDAQRQRQDEELRRTDVAQPAIGAVSLAMRAVLDSFGVKPDATCGHSYGELPALHAAGWIDRETLFDLSATRGRLMAAAGEEKEAGAMLAVKAPIDKVKIIAEQVPDLVLANINGPEQGVLSGPAEAIQKAAAFCSQEGYRSIALPVAAAFHSPLVSQAAAPFGQAVTEATFTPTRIPVYANVTGMPYPAEIPRAVELLGSQLSSPVQFQQTVENLYQSGVRTFVEVGPKAVLSGLVRAILNDREASVIAMDRSSGRSSGILDLAHVIGRLAALGVDVDLTRWESAPPEVRQPKMVIPLSGTNYQTPRKTASGVPSAQPVADPAPAASKPTAKTASKPVASSKPLDLLNAVKPTAPDTPPRAPSVIKQPANPEPSGDMNAALSIVQKGLVAIQSLQQQTTQAHNKFLETQAEASRTLQEMMKQTQWLMGPALDMPGTRVEAAAQPHDAPPPIPERASSTHTIAMTPAPSTASLPPVESLAPTEEIPSAPPMPPTAKTQHPSEDVAAIQDTLLSVVAELTGYPVEMLGLDMDIEADLGIDSIKRVEILSAMEEKMPHLPQITPDMVGTLKTLGQIGGFLTQDQPAAQASPSADPEPQSQATADSAVVQDTLLSVVAELTGYPVEMLGLDMDIEADLGIDSIKRVEILSAMEEKMPHLPSITPDMVGTLKTLGQIGGFLAGAQAAPKNERNAGLSPSLTTEMPAPAGTVPRQIVDAVAAAKKPMRTLQIAPDRQIFILDDHSGLAPALARRLQVKGMPAVIVPLEAIDRPASFTGAAGLILSPLTPPELAFVAAKNAATDLTEAAKQGDALLACVTFLDGAFGFTGNPFDHPEQGALPGLVKTAALEWETVICRAIDLTPGIADADTAAELIADELLAVGENDPVEVGLGDDRRVILKPVPADIEQGPLQLDNTDVVVVTGGARGVTANCALSLARASGAAIALIGRSKAPFDIPSWLDGVEGEAAMKKAIARHTETPTPLTPNDLEAAYRRQAANMSIHRTLDALKAAGVEAAYFSADVTDKDSVNAAIEAVRNRMGAITALIHGAGVLHDRLIADKTVVQFRQVYATKVDGLNHLLAATEGDRLRHLVLFSSVAARTGNIGQCDYAMANEVLNKIARTVALQRPDCRVSAINWGPWDGGMVTPALKKAFDHRDVGLIPIETGAELMVAEMRNIEPGPVEVLIGSMLILDDTDTASSASDEKMALLERRELDLQRYPVLASHVIGGKPVVPFALIGEWIGHGALKENPGFSLHGFDDFRLLSGIRLEQEGKLVRLMAGKARKAGDAWQVDVELRNGVKNGRDLIHSRAKALLVDRFPDAPPFKSNGKNGNHPFPRHLDSIYDEILFHGDHLRAIKTIDSYSEHGMTAQLTGAPKPETWMQDPIRERWMADPMVLDGAFQMAIVWCYERSGKVCLPTYARAYRQYRPAFPAQGVKAVMTVTDHTHRKMVADFTFLDEDHQVVATLSGYEATIDESLIHAFKNNGLPVDFMEVGR